MKPLSRNGNEYGDLLYVSDSELKKMLDGMKLGVDGSREAMTMIEALKANSEESDEGEESYFWRWSASVWIKVTQQVICVLSLLFREIGTILLFGIVTGQ